MIPEEIAWLAGLLEGEGSFMVHRAQAKGKLYEKARVQVSMSDRDVVERVARLFHREEGQSYSVVAQPHRVGKEHHSTIYRVFVNGSRAEEIMQAIRPLMGERRGAKIDEVLSTFNKKREEVVDA
jgi:hypothetical protein